MTGQRPIKSEEALVADVDPEAVDPETPEPGATARPEADAADDEPLPSFSEQMAEQLGGVRGLIESSIPVTAFVVLNLVGSKTHWWSLTASLIASVAAALALAAYRLSRREPIRHALNGVFGIAIGAAFAWRTGEARDFYLPGILYTAGYAVVLLASIVIRRPLVGWLWSVMLDGGATRWYRQPSLLRLFGRLTLLWAAFYLAKVGVQTALFQADQNDWLGVTRIVFGWPPYALLLAITVWSARRVIAREPALAEPAATAGEPPAPGVHRPR